MQSSRWLVSRLPLRRFLAAFAAAGAFLAGLLTHLRPGAVVLMIALALITAGTWELIGRAPALVLLGLLIIRDLERPETPPKS